MKLGMAFICVGNSCRSQMAEGFAKLYAEKLSRQAANAYEIEIYSAGTHPAERVVPEAVQVMKEKGIDISTQYPKTLKEIPEGFDLVFTMGCNVNCPFLPSRFRQDWGLDDPVGKPAGFYRIVRDKIGKKMEVLFDIIRESEDKDEVIEKLKGKKTLAVKDIIAATDIEENKPVGQK
jgi:arsenate reductase